MLIEQRSSLKGEISVSGDRSISHRAIIFGSLAKGTTEIENLLLDEDCLSTIDCFRKLQVGIEILPGNKVKVNGKGLYGLKAPAAPLNTGRSGTALRLVLGMLSGQSFPSVVIREEAAMKKPVGTVVNHLRHMGAVITGKEDGNYCPLSVSPARLTGTSFELGSFETFIKSPLIIAGLYAEGNTIIKEEIKSRDHTELMLNYFGGDVRVNGLEVTCRSVENLYAQHITIPGDISAAAYFITAALLVPNSDLTIRNVGINPTRSGILDVYKEMGANIKILNEYNVGGEKVADLHISNSGLKAVKVGGEMIPRLIDEIPVLIIAAALAEGTTEITGLSGFKTKESGKLKLLAGEMAKMGAIVRETADGVVVEGGRKLRGTVVECHNDTAIAMSLAIAGLVAPEETTIRKSQVVEASYPSFFSMLNKL